jgi:arylsulfatase A-like enzyme
MKRITALVALVALIALTVGEPTMAQPARNIVVIMTDDQDVAGLPVMRHLLGYPHGGWVHFTNAFANASLCCPARATLLTGQYAHNHKVLSNAAKHTGAFDKYNTLATWLDDAGYQTALIGKYLNRITDKQPGWDVWQAGKGTVDAHTNKALDFIEQTTGPFFLHLSYMAPHTPANPPARYANADVFVPPDSPAYLEADVSDKPLWVRQLPIPGAAAQESWRQERLDAQRELLAVDDGVLAVVEALEARGVLDDTLIIFLGDQGFSWGDNRWFYKHCAYDTCSRFPLLIRYPEETVSSVSSELPNNRNEPRFVSNVSLASTIAEWAGVTPGRPQDAPSLGPLLRGEPVVWDETILIEKRAAQPSAGKFWGVRAPGWMYAEYDNGDRELYDMTADAWQLNNVAGRVEYAAVQLSMAAKLAAMKQ